MRSRPSHPQVVAGAPPITPTVAWYDPSNLSTITQSGGLVTQLDDLTGNAHHLYVPFGSTSFSPSTGVYAIGGLNALLFGQTKKLRTDAFSAAQPITMFAVIQCLFVTGTQQFIFGADTSMRTTQTTNRWAMEGSTNVASTVAVDFYRHVIALIANGASSILELDGVQIAAGNPGTAGVGGNGIIMSEGEPGIGFNGIIGEAMMFSSALSDPDRLATFTYLRAKWGTT